MSPNPCPAAARWQTHAVFAALFLLAAPVAPRADVNPPEVKDAAPEARQNVQEKNKDGAEAKCVASAEPKAGERRVGQNCPPERK